MSARVEWAYDLNKQAVPFIPPFAQSFSFFCFPFHSSSPQHKQSATPNPIATAASSSQPKTWQKLGPQVRSKVNCSPNPFLDLGFKEGFNSFACVRSSSIVLLCHAMSCRDRRGAVNLLSFMSFCYRFQLHSQRPLYLSIQVENHHALRERETTNLTPRFLSTFLAQLFERDNILCSHVGCYWSFHPRESETPREKMSWVCLDCIGWWLIAFLFIFNGHQWWQQKKTNSDGEAFSEQGSKESKKKKSWVCDGLVDVWEVWKRRQPHSGIKVYILNKNERKERKR